MITTGFGLGMFFYNLVCLMIGLAIIYIIIRNIRWNMIRLIFIVGIVMTLTGCAKDIDLNPYTTIVRHMLTTNSKWLIN